MVNEQNIQQFSEQCGKRCKCRKHICWECGNECKSSGFVSKSSGF